MYMFDEIVTKISIRNRCRYKRKEGIEEDSDLGRRLEVL